MYFVRRNGIWLGPQARVDKGCAEDAGGPRDREFFWEVHGVVNGSFITDARG